MGGPAVREAFEVRAGRADDAEAIAAVQIAGWRAAYGHFLPATFLDGLDAAARAERWRGRLGDLAAPDSPTFVAVDGGGAGMVRGFVHTGPSRDEDLVGEDRAEIYTLYVDPPSWRCGIGAMLIRAVDAFWGPRNMRELVLWTFEDSAGSRAFYERLGWTADGARKIEEFGGTSLPEVRYRRAVR